MKNCIKKSLLVLVILSIFNSTWAISAAVPNKIINPSEKKTVAVGGEITGPAAVCLNQANVNVTFTGSGGTAPYTFTYQIGTGANATIVTTTGNTVTLPLVTSAAGTFVYTLVSIHDSVAPTVEIAQTDTYTVTVKPLPSANVGANKTICDNSSTTIGVTTVTGSTYSWTASPTDTSLTTTTVSAPSVSPNATTIYTLTETNNGCSDSNSVTVTVNPLPTISGATNVCVGSTSNLSGSGVANATTPWTSSNTAVATIDNTGIVTGILAGTTNITYKNSNGCLKTIVFTVKALPVVDFTFTNNQCSGSSVSFNSTVTGTGPFTYAWDFGDGGTSSSSDPSHVFNASTGNGVDNFNVTLIITNTTTNCEKSIPKTVSVKQLPDPTLNGTGLSVFNGLPIFKKCQNTSNVFTFSNSSSTTSTNTNYIINWGDSTTNFSGSSWTTLTHQYSIGFWTMTYTITGNNGCVSIKTYNVFVGSNPAVSLGNPGNTDVCNSEALTFPITLTTNNPPGTVYTVTFNDGSIPQVFNHPPPSEVNHTFLTTSCGTNSSNGSTPFPNSFSANIVAVNPCGTSSIGVVPIYVSTPPLANFSLPIEKTCTNNVICVSNTSTGSNQNDSGICSTNPNIVWIITPNSGFVLNSGTLGNDFNNNDPSIWIAGSASICPKFIIPGEYTIRLKVGNRCSVDETFKTICVEAPLSPLFTLNKTESCTPAVVNTTNTTVISNSCTGNPTYLWDVQYAGDFCGSGTPTWSYATGSATTANPSFNFVTPGTYSIKVTMTNSCGAVTSAIQTVIVKKPPTVAINSIPDFCLFTPLNATAAINSCSPTTSPAMTYLWTFTNGLPATSALQTPPAVNYAVTGNYTIGLSVTNQCGTTSDTKSFNVKPAATIQNDAQTLCSGGTFSITPSQSTAGNVIPTGTTYSWGTPVSSPSGAITGGSAQSNQNNISQTLVNTTNTVATLTYSITPRSGICDGTTFTVVVTVNPKPVIADVIPAALCSVNSFSVSPTNGGGTSSTDIVPAGTTYSWTISTNPNLSGQSASSATGITTISQTLTNSTNSNQSLTYTVTPKSGIAGNCIGASFTITVTVNPKPTIAIVAPTAICSGNSFTVTPINGGGSSLNDVVPAGTIYTWANPISTPTGVITGGSLQSTGQGSISQVLTNTTSSQANLTYTVTPKSGNCIGSNFTIVIPVNSKPVISNVTPAAICSGNSFTVTPANNGGTNSTDIVPTGTTYTWTVSTNPNLSGQSASSATGITTISQTLTNSTNSNQSLTYTVTPTSGTTGNCVGATFTINVNVNPKPTIANAIPAAICSGNPFTVSPINGGGSSSTDIVPAGTTYTWTISSNTNISGQAASSITGITTIGQTLTSSSNVVQTLTYTVTPTSGATGSCVGNTFTIIVTVNPKPTIANTTATICSGMAFNVSPLNGGGSSTNDIVPLGTTYSWAIPVSGPNGAITGGSTGTNVSGPISQTLTNGTSLPATLTYNVTPKLGSCTGPSFTIIVTVNPSPAVTFSPAPQTICSGDNTAAVTLSSATTGATFSWTTPAVPGITGIVTPGTNTIPIQNLINTTNAPITVTYSATATTASGVNCLGASFDYTVIVKPKPVVGETFNPITCSGSNFTVTPNALATQNNISTGTTYSWSAPSATGITGGASGNNQTSISGTLTNITNTAVNVTYSVTPSTNGCAGAAFNVVVTVNPKPVIPTQNTIICSESNFTVLPINNAPTVIIPSGTSYSWVAPTITGITGSAAGSNQSSITGTLTNITNAPINVTYNVTATSGIAPNTCTNTFSLVVTVNPKPFIANQTATTCSGTAFNVPLTNAPPALILPAGTTFTWTVASVTGINGTSNQTTAATAIGQVLTNTTNAPIDVVYNVTASSGTSPNNCTSTFTVTVTVNPKPLIPAQTIAKCSGTSFAVTPTNNLPTTVVPNGTTYSWAAPVVSGITGAGAGSNQTSITGNLTNTTTAPIDVVYSIIASSGTAPNNCTSTFNVTVTVNPSPSVIFSPTPQTICSENSTGIVTLSSSSPGVSFAWTAVQPVGITGVINSSIPGNNTIPVQTLVNTTNAPITVTYSATATTASGVNCLGASFDYTVIVKPKPVVGETFNPITCSGSNFTVTPNALATQNNISTGTTYSWSAPSATGITGGASGNNQTSISGTLTNITNTAVNVTYSVTPSTNGCAGAAFNVVVTVNPKPVIPTQNTIICSESNFTVLPINNAPTVIIPSGTSYSWVAPTITGITGSAAGSNQSSITGTLTNITNAPINVTYNVTATSGIAPNTCTNTFSLVVTVNPKPFIANQTATTCSGTAFNVPLTNAPPALILPAGTTFTWTVASVTGINGTSNQTTAATAIGQVLTNTTNAPIDVVYNVTASSGTSPNNCTSTFTVTVTVNPKPLIPAQTIAKCSGTSFAVTPTNNLPTTVVPNGTTYSWAAPVVSGITGAGAGSNQTSITGNLTNTTTAPIDVVYSIIASSGTAPNNCTSTFNVTVTVNPSPSVIFSPTPQTICSENSTGIVTLSSSSPGVSFAWTAVQPVGITGVINSSIPGNNTIPVQTLVNTTNAPITVTYSATATTASGVNCLGASFDYTVIVKPKPVVGETFNPITCSGSNFTVTPNALATQNNISTGTTYSWSAPSATGITGGASGNNQTSISGTLTNITNTAVNVTYSVTPSTNGCAGAAFNVVVTVNPKPVIPTQNTTICSESNFTVLPINNAPTVIIPSGTSYSWVAPTITGITGSAAGSNQSSITGTLTNITNAPINVTYNVTATSGIAPNTCTNTFSLVVTVNPKPFIANQTATTCSGTAFTVPLTNAPPALILPAGTTFTWTVASVTGINGTSNQTTAATAIGQVLTNTTNAPIDVVYNVTASSGTSPNNCTSTFTVTVTVNPKPLIPAQTITKCSGTSFTVAPVNALPTTIVPNGTTYTWSAPSVTGITGSVAGNSQPSITGTLTNTTNAPINVTYSVTASSGTTPNNCTSTFTVTVTVNPSPSVTFSPIPQTICSENPTGLVTLSSTSPGVSFAWTAIQPIGITGVATSGTGTIPVQTLANSTNAPITVTYSATATTASGVNCLGASFDYTVIVKPKPAVGETFNPITCSGSNFTVTPNALATQNNISTGTTYSWSAPSATGITGGASGNNQTSISGTLTNITNTAVNVTYSVTPSTNGCAGAAFTVVVTVNPKPVIPTQNTIICSESNFTVLPINNAPTVIIPSGTSYSWVAPTITGITGSAAGSNQSSITGTLTNITNAPINVTYNVTATSGIAPNTCTNTFNLVVTVNPKPFIANQTATTCSGTAFTVPLTNAPPALILPAGTTFTWTVASVTGINGTSNQTTAATAIGQTLTNTTNAPINVIYNVTASFGTSPNNCTTTFNVTVTVNPKPLIPAQTITKCSGTSFTVAPVNALPTTVVPNGTTYTWSAPSVTGITGSVAGNNQPSITGTLTNTTNAPINVTYSVTASSGTTPNNCTSTFNVTVTVNPSPSVTFSPTPQTICSENSTGLVTLSSTSPGVSFAWTAIQPVGITGVATSGTGTIPVQTLANSTNAPITVTYSATATTASGVNCLGASFDYTVIVKPKPAVGETFNPIACSGSSFTVTPNITATQNSIPTGTTYSWSAPSVTGGMTGGAITSNQPTINGTLINPTNTAQTATYTVTPTANGCSGATFTVVVTVNPKPVIANVTPAAICSGTAFTVTPTNGGATIIPTGTTYTWTISTNNTNITGQSDSTVAGVSSISQTLTNTSFTAQSLTYTVTPTSGAAGNCVGATFTIVVTVNPAIVASGIVTQVTISGLSNGAVDVSASGGSGNYTYSWSGPNGFSAVTQDISSVPAGTYILTINDGVCPPKILTFIITSPLPLIIQENLANHLNELCNGASTASVTIEITQGSIGPYDYSIALQSGGSAGSALAINALNYSFTGLAAGTYTATVTDFYGSTKIITGIIITEPTLILTSISAQTNVDCNGNNTGSATVSASGGTPGTIGTGYTYSWSSIPVQTSATATGLTQGAYTVTVKDGNLCAVQQQVVITEPSAIVSSITSKTDVLCFGNATGAATVFASGGTPGTLATGYTYSWNTNPIQTTLTAINLVAGTYTVTIKDDQLCTKTQQVTILQPTAALSAVISNSTNVSCYGGNNGTATVSASNGTGPYTYSWNTTPVQTSATATGLAQGTYIVTTTDANLCTITSSVTITEPAVLSGTITAQTNVLCSGNSTGAATVTPIGGTGPFSYSWNTAPNQTSPTATGLAIGTYTVTITDFKGCTTTVDAIITEPNGIVTAIATQTNVDCFGNSTGSATISASGGNGLLTYSWSPNSNTSVSATGLSAGTYNVTVTDANGCSKLQTVVITQPIAPLTTLFASYNDISCNGGNDGAIAVTANGGTTPYTYSWNTTPVQTTSTASNLTIGTYTLTVTDANLCTTQITKTLVEPNELLITVNSITPIICYGSTSGAIAVSISQASIASYNYTISGINYLGTTYSASQTQSGLNYTFTGLLAGNYTITITDANGCSKQISNNLVTQPASALQITNPIISNYNGFSSSCFGANNGSINIQTQGGYLPYTFQWTGPSGFTAVTEDISGLAPGIYNLTIIDNGGCSIPYTYTITEPLDIVINTDLEKDITCFNDADGEILLTITGGTSTYTYSWTKDGSAFATTQDLSNLAPGTYTVTVSDNNLCGPKTQSYTITQPPILAISLVSQTNILCYGFNTGTIAVNVVGGTPILIAPGIYGYQYEWTGPNGFASSSQNLTALFAGSYQLKVTDNSGCFKELTVVLTQPNDVIISYTTTPISCYGANDASITLTIVGGVAPYDILWSNLGHGLFQDNLAADNYTIIVTDANACVKTIVVPIPEAPIFTIYPVVKNISCFGANNGSIILNIVGGVAPVSLLWSDNPSAGNQRNNLGPGTYTVTISDGKPCYINRTFTILEPQELILSANVTNAFDCNDANSGNINLLVAGGSAPFSYNWSNGATTEDLTNIPAGNYQVTVTDLNGCFKTVQYSINRQPPIVIAVTTNTDFDCNTKSVKQTFVAQVSGGVPPFQLAWSSGTVSGVNNELMNTNQNGTVVLTATDNLGCIQNYSFNVQIPTLGDASFSTTSYAYTTYGSYSMQDPIQFTNTSTGDFVSVVWDFGDGSVSNDPNPIHFYVKEGNYIVTQTVTYPFGCIYVFITTLVVDKGYELIMPTAFTPNDDKINDYFTPVSKGLQSLELNVYDSWGELIYSEKGATIQGWNGKMKNVNSENGNYYFKVIAKTFYGGIINRNGAFTLIK